MLKYSTKALNFAYDFILLVHFLGQPVQALFFANRMVLKRQKIVLARPSQLAKLSHREFDPELFSHSAYDNIF